MRLWCVRVTAAVLITVSAGLFLVALSDLLVGAAAGDANLDNIFRDRSLLEWKEAWHREKYARCRQTLLRHLEWACEKDIYRITRRSMPLSYEDLKASQTAVYPIYPAISAMEARQMLRRRRGGTGGVGRRGNSITAECCSSTGCTWEEYAEYCPTNKRRVEFTYT